MSWEFAWYIIAYTAAVHAAVSGACVAYIYCACTCNITPFCVLVTGGM